MRKLMLVATMQDESRAFFTRDGLPVVWVDDAEGRRALEQTIAELVAGEGNLGDLFETHGEGWRVLAIEIVETRVSELRTYGSEARR